jgi:hypothetical protein
MATPTTWYGALFVAVRDGVYVLRHATRVPAPRTVDGVIEVSGPARLPAPSRPLNREEMRAWVTAWTRAGYNFKVVG